MLSSRVHPASTVKAVQRRARSATWQPTCGLIHSSAPPILEWRAGPGHAGHPVHRPHKPRTPARPPARALFGAELQRLHRKVKIKFKIKVKVKDHGGNPPHT